MDPDDAHCDVFYDALSKLAEKQLEEVAAYLCNDFISNKCGSNITNTDDAEAVQDDLHSALLAEDKLLTHPGPDPEDGGGKASSKELHFTIWREDKFQHVT